MNKPYTTNCIIIGSGFAGIGMAIRLREAGFNEFIILEKNKHAGGTWYDNHYPGAACDVQSHLYSFSFELNPNWSRIFSPQQEILQYIDHCIAKYDIDRHIRYTSEVKGADYDEVNKQWTVHCSDGKTYSGKILINASGGLSRPAFPDIKGLETFQGEKFHTAQWKEDYELKGKKIGIIGTGASAIQIIPSIVNQVQELKVFQRTPSWVIPKPDGNISPLTQKILKALPIIRKAYRNWLYITHELTAIGFIRYPLIMKAFAKIASRYLNKQVKDPVLREKLRPDYVIGCKRVLLSNEYYRAMQSENLELINSGIQEIVTKGIKTIDGRETELDTIILATGFRAAENGAPFPIKGPGNLDLNESWKSGPEAYLGTTIKGFPNLFLIVGPNTGLGHSSMILMIEAQIAYILDALKQMKTHNWKSVEIKENVSDAFNADLQEQLKGTVWQSGGCRSWYQNKDGKNVTLWPGFTFSFMWKTRKFKPSDYNIK